MHIAIEGMDGVGKTSVAKILSARLGFRLVEKPMHLLLDEQGNMENYFQCRNYINAQTENDALRAWFYGLGNLLLCHHFKNEHVITDRHLLSNYYWCGGPDTEDIFKCLVSITGNPDHTILLYASAEEGARRIKKRNPKDPDIFKTKLYSDSRVKMEDFLKRYKMPYIAIDTTELRPEEVVEVIMQWLQRNSSTQEQADINMLNPPRSAEE